jgi:predicted phage terminase large subunit-like protein
MPEPNELLVEHRQQLALPGPVAREFVLSPAIYRVLIGPIASGKKVTLILDIVGRAYRSPGQRWRCLAVAATGYYAEAHVLPAITKVIGDGGRWSERPVPSVTVPLLRADGGLFAEIEIQVLGLDRTEHRARLLNLERTAVCLFDTRRLPESVFEDAAQSIGTYPPEGEVAGWLAAESRPPMAGHWLVQRQGIAVFCQPGGRTPEAENPLGRQALNFSYERRAKNMPPGEVASDIDGEIAGSAEATAAEASRAASRNHMTFFARVVMPEHEPAAHHRFIIDKLEKVACGEIKRLMLFLPPGSAKSTYASVLFPPWWMGNHPGLPVIAASHSKELAERFGRRVRNIVGSPAFRDIFGFGLSGDSGAAGRWETARGGEYFAVGVDASVTGRRAALGIIDDPVKGIAEAKSPTVRQHVWDWYKADFWTRLIPGAAIIYIGTRWHDDDLAGRLLEEAKEGGEQWEVVSLPMEAEEDDPLGRPVGRILWDEWFTPELVATAKSNVENWSALYQQRPVPESGDYFQAAWFRWYDKMPPREELRTYGASDYATKAGAGDWTVHLVVGIDPKDDIYVLDVWRQRSSSDQWAEALIDLMQKWGTITWAEEAGQIRNSVGPFLTKRQLERKVYNLRHQFTSSTDKPTRAQSIRGRAGMGKVYLPRSTPWVMDFYQELLRFPAGRYDDQIDAFSLIGRMLDGMTPGTAAIRRPQPLAEPPPGVTLNLAWTTAPGGINDPYRRGDRRI